MDKPIINDETHKSKTRSIEIAPGTRLEGHLKIPIFLDENGNVEAAYMQIVELRGFEEFCKGRPVEEIPRIVTRLCGVCPWPHHIASSKVIDRVFGVDIPPAARKIKEIGYLAHILESHIEHFYVLGPAPDFILGPSAPPEKRNILGVIEAVGLEIGSLVIKNRGNAVKIEEIIGGKSTHPVFCVPGGISKPLTPEERIEIIKMAKELVEFSKFTLQIVHDVVLSNKDYVDLILSKDVYYHETYYLGTVDDEDNLNLYEGDLKIVDPTGKEVEKFKPENYLDYFSEHVEPWTYLKFPVYKKVGWNGLTDGIDSGIMRAAPLGRLNVIKGIPTPLAQKAYEEYLSVLGGKPVHNTLAFHWARAIEVQYAAERLLELLEDDSILSTEVRTIPDPAKFTGEGIGVIEAPRGTLIHHYVTDKNGMVTNLNLIVASAFNHGGMCLSVEKAAKALIKNWQVSQGLLNKVEMAFRTYDPCLSCATHAFVGELPMEISLINPDGTIFKKITSD